MNASPIEIQRALAGADYPATRSDLIVHAEEGGASEDVLADLESLDDDDEFEGPAAVMAALGEDAEDLDEDEDEDEDRYGE